VNRAFTRAKALFNKVPLGRIAGERKSSYEVLYCGIILPILQLKLTECSMVKGIASKPFRIPDRMKFLQPA
jgi:hypothetical protein